MITLDGSLGEGGGQVLRTALSLSLVTGEPFVIDKIRAGREKPGLKRQHLTAVLAAAEIAAARVEGAELGSSRLSFRPGRLRAGDYSFAMATAGSTTLVLQTLLPALLTADAPSSLRIGGGTHNPLAPPFEFVVRSFGRALAAMGASIDLQIERYGFAPAGGGMLTANIRPAQLQPLALMQRQPSGLPGARALLSKLSPSIAERELRVVRKRLDFHPDRLRIHTVDAHGPGNMLLLEFPGAVADDVIAVPGERGVTAEQVAYRACEQALAFLAADVPVGEHLADQLLIPMALARGGEFRTVPPSEHTKTNALVIERFLPVRFDVRADGANAHVVAVRAV